MKSLPFSLASTCLAAITAYAAPDEVTYNAHIRPIMSDKCIACHGPDSKKREADLRLDTFEGATAFLKGSSTKQTIVPGHPEKSEMFVRIDSHDHDKVMPPPHYHKEVTKEERELLWKWVKQGAEYEEHWAYTPIRKTKPGITVENPVDGFIADRLKAEGIEPSPLASHAQLLRRLSLDLTGLPPSSKEVTAFEQAAAKNFSEAYEAEVTRLLASPHFGERMAVPWLDIVRFSDTVGYHGDQNVRIFPYRDYVINAFNANKPFDDFVIEQLAGDLLENPTTEQLIATGFNRLNMMSREGGIQPKEYLIKYTADRVRAIGQVFLGQTTGCAECHDHKFDPISAKDFYSLGAFFDDIQQWGVYQDYGPPFFAGLKGFNNTFPFPPELVHESQSRLKMIEALQADLIAVLGSREVAPDHLESWRQKVEPALSSATSGWLDARLLKAESVKETAHTLLEDGSVEFTGGVQKDDILTLSYTLPAGSLGSIRLEALPSAAAGGKVGRAENGKFTIRGPESPLKEGEKKSRPPKREKPVQLSILSADGSETPLELAWSQADIFSSNLYRNGDYQSLTLDQGWMAAPGRFERPLTLNQQTHAAVFSLKNPVAVQAGDTLIARLHSGDVARLKLSVTPFLSPVPGQPAAPEALLNAFQSNNSEHLNAAYHLSSRDLGKLPQNARQLINRIRAAKAGWARTLITATREKEQWLKTRILPRGDWQDESGPIVEPAVFEFLPSESVPKDRRLTRLDLAKWLVADENPLTARHFVNRTWKQFFGSGLSNVLADLGAQGEWPSHPRLLDWLAADFRENGWDVKHLIRTIVTSQSYQREAATRDDLKDVDPHYRLYAQQAPRRLDAEFVRDNAFSISGLLNTRLTGGPSVKPYQPAGYYAAINFPRRSYQADRDENQYRRGVYMHWQRTFLHPMLANFDAPTRTECAADRLQANSPQQALTMLNDPSFVEAARAFATRLMQDEQLQADKDFITAAYKEAIARAPRPEELESLTAFLQTQRENFTTGQDDAGKLLTIGLHRSPDTLEKNELAAKTQLCRVILNLHETITRY